MAKSSTSFVKGQPANRTGRPKGSPNKATADIKAIATRLVNDPGYVASLEVRLKRGTAGAVEPLLFHYAYGKPKEVRELTGADGAPLVVQWMRDADDD